MVALALPARLSRAILCDTKHSPLPRRRPLAVVTGCVVGAALAVSAATAVARAVGTPARQSDSVASMPVSSAAVTSVHSGAVAPQPPASDPSTTVPPSPPPIPPAPPGPPDISPLLTPALAGEGHWSPLGRLVAGQPAVFATMLRAPSGAARVALAWMDTSLLRVVPYAGTAQPAGTWSAQGMVPVDARPQLVAAFNGGFQFNVAGGGWYADGRIGIPLRPGAASLVAYRDGSARVLEWGRDGDFIPDVVAVRQNLTLLVDGGAPARTVSSPGLWGETLGHVVRTWRSALGDDDHGHLIYAAGPNLDVADLAAVLVAAGAQRAMELDINPEWVLFTTFTGDAGSIIPTKLLPGMYFGADHFLFSDWRDFVAVFAAPPPRMPPRGRLG